MDKQRDSKVDGMSDTLRRLFPRAEIHRMLDDLAGQRLPCSVFRTFVWHTMPKAVTETLVGRRWELVESDLRHQAMQMAVIYAMHCVYERAAKGRLDISLVRKETEQWTWGSKAG